MQTCVQICVWTRVQTRVCRYRSYIVMAYIVMAHIVMAYIVMAHIVMACIVIGMDGAGWAAGFVDYGSCARTHARLRIRAPVTHARIRTHPPARTHARTHEHAMQGPG